MDQIAMHVSLMVANILQPHIHAMEMPQLELQPLEISSIMLTNASRQVNSNAEEPLLPTVLMV
jgi:hypothetical protein